MPTPFPGMDPYLEHPVLWTGVHASLIGTIRRQLAPVLRPRYIASVEERVYIEIPEEVRVPDVWIQKARNGGTAVATLPDLAEPVVLEVPRVEVHEYYLEILDRYQDLKVVTVIEVISPTNKRAGPGREAYLKKQQSTLASECHLVEIDLLRNGDRTIGVPESRLSALRPFEYLISVNRWPKRDRFELYPLRLRNRLPRFKVPLVAPDPDVPLDVQAALEQVYEDGSYMLRVKYHGPCVPPLSPDDQTWADECWASYRKAHPDLFPES